MIIRYVFILGRNKGGPEKVEKNKINDDKRAVIAELRDARTKDTQL